MLIRDMFCSDCQKGICEECIISQEHVGHKITSLKEYLNGLRSQAQQELLMLERSHKNLIKETDQVYWCLVSKNRLIQKMIERKIHPLVNKFRQNLFSIADEFRNKSFGLKQKMDLLRMETSVSERIAQNLSNSIKADNGKD